MTKKKKHHCIVTLAVGLSVVAHYILEHIAPDYSALSPLAGFGANMVWIWLEEA